MRPGVLLLSMPHCYLPWLLLNLLENLLSSATTILSPPCVKLDVPALSFSPGAAPQRGRAGASAALRPHAAATAASRSAGPYISSHTQFLVVINSLASSCSNSKFHPFTWLEKPLAAELATEGDALHQLTACNATSKQGGAGTAVSRKH